MRRNLHATGAPIIPPINGLSGNHATRQQAYGLRIQDEVGNVFRYVKANEALTKGDVVTAIARAAWDSGIAVDGAITANTTNVLHIDTITTAMTKNQYAGYYVSQATAATKGAAFMIESHEAMAASGEGDLILTETMDEAFANDVALLIHNPWLVEKADATTEVIIGVAVHDITSGYFGWIQVGGYCAKVKCGSATSAAIVANEPMIPNGTGTGKTEGAVEGMAGSAEGDIMEAAASPLIALRAVGADTPGFTEAWIKER